jgi:putative NIF3 family GTP cyclohydrolase 1 type 2
MERMYHFTAQYHDYQDGRVYFYDDQMGKAVLLEKGKVKMHVAGATPQLCKGHEVHQVVYHLHGGLAAQDHFYQLRCAALRTYHSLLIEPTKSPASHLEVSYESDTHALLHPDCRTWLLHPNRDKLKEYVAKKVANKRVEFTVPPKTPESKDTKEDPADNHGSNLPLVFNEPPLVTAHSRNINLIKTWTQKKRGKRAKKMTNKPPPSHLSPLPLILPSPSDRSLSLPQNLDEIISSHDKPSNPHHSHLVDIDMDDSDSSEVERILNGNLIHCRCGVNGPKDDVLLVSVMSEGPLVACSWCGRMLHAACQADGLQLPPPLNRECHLCCLLDGKVNPHQHEGKEVTNQQ